MNIKFPAIVLALAMLGCNHSPENGGAAVAEGKGEAEAVDSLRLSPTVDSLTEGPEQGLADTLRHAEEMKAYEAAHKIEDYLVPALPTKDFTTVSENAGVLIGPDSIQIATIKEEMGDDLYIIADDAIYYDYVAFEFLEQKGFKVVYPKTRYIRFVGKGREYYFDTKSKAATGWTAVLFSPSKPSPRHQHGWHRG